MSRVGSWNPGLLVGTVLLGVSSLVSTGQGARANEDPTPTPTPAVAEAPLPPDPFDILGRSAWLTPPLVAASYDGGSISGPLSVVLELARTDPGAALARLRDPGDPLASNADRPLIIAGLELRIAAPANRVEARAALRNLQSTTHLPKLDPWVALECARVDLFLGWYPEAAAGAYRASSTGKEHGYSEDFREAADLLRAEALYLAGRSDSARSIYERLAASNSVLVRTSAGIRQVDLRFEAGESVRYEAVLARAVEQGLDVRPWWPRAAAAAVREGDLETAEGQFQRFLDQSASSPITALAEIRLADLLVSRDGAEEARKHLRAVEKANEGLPVGLLAGIRLASLDLDAGESEAALARLTAAAESIHMGISAYANARLGRAELEAGRLDEAFHALGRASRAGSANPLAEETRSDLVRAAYAAVEASHAEDGCHALVLRLTVRRNHITGLLAEPTPLIRLGACFEEIGLHETAYRLYRSIPRIFGPQMATTVALPLARAALASGEIQPTRTRALAYAVQPDALPDWVLLLAEASLANGEPKPAVEVLARVVLEDETTGHDPRTLGLLAGAALDSDADAETLALLERRLVELPDGLDAEGAETVGEAALATATALRRASELERARNLYAIAVRYLPDGWRLVESGYWLARLGPGEGAAPSDRAMEPGDGPDGSDVLKLIEHAHGLAALREAHQLPADLGMAEESLQ